MHIKIFTLIVCIIATSTIFWANNSSSHKSQDAIQDETSESGEAHTVLPIDPTTSNEHLIVTDMDRMTDARNLVEFRKEYRLLMREADGNLDEVLAFVENEFTKRNGPMTRNSIEATRRSLLLLMPGEIPNPHIRSIADRKRDSPELINEMVWKFVARTQTGETIPDLTIDALIYAIDIAAESAPQDWHVFDTKSHLHEIDGDLEAAVNAAKKTVELCPSESKAKYEEYLEELRTKLEQADNNLSE